MGNLCDRLKMVSSHRTGKSRKNIPSGRFICSRSTPTESKFVHTSLTPRWMLNKKAVQSAEKNKDINSWRKMLKFTTDPPPSKSPAAAAASALLAQKPSNNNSTPHQLQPCPVQPINNNNGDNRNNKPSKGVQPIETRKFSKVQSRIVSRHCSDASKRYSTSQLLNPVLFSPLLMQGGCGKGAGGARHGVPCSPSTPEFSHLARSR